MTPDPYKEFRALAVVWRSADAIVRPLHGESAANMLQECRSQLTEAIARAEQAQKSGPVPSGYPSSLCPGEDLRDCGPPIARAEARKDKPRRVKLPTRVGIFVDNGQAEWGREVKGKYLLLDEMIANLHAAQVEFDA